MSINRVTKDNLCIHCGKDHWCYFTDNIYVCCRHAEAATGWVKTGKLDKSGYPIYVKEEINNKTVLKPKTTVYKYPDRQGLDLVKVIRLDDSQGKKSIHQKYWNGQRWLSSLKGCKKSNIPIYRYSEIREAIARSETIFIVEGEKCVDAMWDIGLAATTSKGGLNPWLSEHTQDLDGANQIVLCPDRDEVGIKKMLAVGQHFPKALWLYAPPNDYIWSHLPDRGGSDVADWISSGATVEDILNRIGDRLPSISSPSPKVELPQENFTQIAIDALYSSTNYISINNELYQFQGKYYSKVSEFTEKRRIAEWCESTPMTVSGGKRKYSLANTGKVEEIYKWAIITKAIDPSDVNPSGINCLNGVVFFDWIGKRFRIQLLPHSPNLYYTYCTDIEYNPNADSTYCDRLLAVLDPPQQEIFLKTISASIDLPRVRKSKAGSIKALLLQGTGSNGKDSLWQAVASILGETMTQISFADFKQYDDGRKFDIARLENARVCWASENSQYISLDNVQILKQAITGEKIVIEQKNSTAYLLDANCVFLFNVNKAPLIDGGLEAIKRRYSVINFNKTFCSNANFDNGELEADSRFRYDKEFINTQIAPALLNKLLEAFSSLIETGIDYSSIDSAFDLVRKESNHLWEFVDDVGLTFDSDSEVYLKDIWELIEDWYLERDILEIGNNRRYWQPPVRKGDDYVKSSRLLYSRLKDLFPGIKKKKDTTRGSKNSVVISGLSLVNVGGNVGGKMEVESFSSKEIQKNVGGSKAKSLCYTQINFLKSQIKSLTSSQHLELSLWLSEILSTKKSDVNVENLPYLPPTSLQPPPRLRLSLLTCLPLCLPHAQKIQRKMIIQCHYVTRRLHWMMHLLQKLNLSGAKEMSVLRY